MIRWYREASWSFIHVKVLDVHRSPVYNFNEYRSQTGSPGTKNMRDHRREIFIVLAFGLVLGRTESLMKILRSWFSQRPRILADPLRLSILPGVSASRARSKKYLARVGKGFSGCWVAFGLLSKKSTNKAVHGHTPRCRWLDHLKAGRNKVSPQILKFVDSGHAL